MSPNELRLKLHRELPTLFQCELRDRGDVRVTTPFLLPDRDLVDLFLVTRNDGTVMTDYGLAMSWLRMHSESGVIPSTTRATIRSIIDTLDVSQQQGQLETNMQDSEDLPHAIHRLGQAVTRVADLWYSVAFGSNLDMQHTAPTVNQ